MGLFHVLAAAAFAVNSVEQFCTCEAVTRPQLETQKLEDFYLLLLLLVLFICLLVLVCLLFRLIVVQDSFLICELTLLRFVFKCQLCDFQSDRNKILRAYFKPFN